MNHVDVVTRVPLLAQNYRHVGRHMDCGEDGTFHADASAGHIARTDLEYRRRLDRVP